MRIRSVMVATLLFGSSLVLAQVCPSTPGSVCLVPSRSATVTQATTYTLPSTMTSTVTTVPYTGTMGMTPMAMTTMPVYTTTGTCPVMGASSMGTMPIYGTTAVVVPYSGSMYSSVPSMYSMPTSSMYGTRTMGTTPMYGTVAVVPYSGGMYGTTPSFTMASTTPMMGSTSMGTTPMYYYQTTTPSSMGMTSAMPMGTMPMTGMSTASAACQNLSPESACMVRSIQGTIRATALEARGQDLVTRMNRLMAGEMLFRQQIAANPNLPNAQVIAFGLSQDADALNRDLASFNQELSLIPVDQRPYLASDLNAFTVAYWDPTMQQFTTYRGQFATSAYQPAYAANPWLQNWSTGYQTSLNNLAVAPQNYASVNWWSSTRVLGSTETYQSGTLPAGVQYVPAGAMTPSTTMMQPEQNALPATMPTPATGY